MVAPKLKTNMDAPVLCIFISAFKVKVFWVLFVCLFDCLVCSDWFIMYFSSSLIILGTFQYSKSVISCLRESFQFIVSPKFPEIIKRYGFRGFIDLILIVSFP